MRRVFLENDFEFVENEFFLVQRKTFAQSDGCSTRTNVLMPGWCWPLID